MKRKNIFILIVIVLVVAGVLFVAKKKREIARLAPPHMSPPAVQVVPVKQGTLEITSHYLGTIAPFVRSDLSARISGNILTINKREGDPVRKGELLVTIDARELQDRTVAVNSEVLATRQRLAGARSAYETQNAVYERDQTLYKSGAISREALEHSRAALDGTRSVVDAYNESLKGLAMNTKVAKTQAGYARIYAPFAGVVSKRWNEPGDLAVPGKPILTIDKSAPFKVLAQVPQEELAPLHAGTPVYLTNGDLRLSTRVNRIYPALGKSMLATVEVIVSAAPFRLPADATVGVDLVARKATGLIVPDQAVVKNGQQAFIYVVTGNTVHLRPVTLLGTGNGTAAVTGDLHPGEQVAVAQENRLLTLVEGAAVTPMANKVAAPAVTATPVPAAGGAKP
ncbi:MAG: efflux RND transporter periplasmic adaptor subunit [Desulfuromonadaceae bacterium]|nr:efflux RND transporter periplasmic adaptor subunit [Desulfuromonadaceae bacterium]